VDFHVLSSDLKTKYIVIASPQQLPTQFGLQACHSIKGNTVPMVLESIVAGCLTSDVPRTEMPYQLVRVEGSMDNIKVKTGNSFFQ
jgi:hypothetical protein